MWHDRTSINKGAAQSVHPHSPISALVIRVIQWICIIQKLNIQASLISRAGRFELGKVF